MSEIRLARELAARTGETLTDAILVALRERLARETGRTASYLEAAIVIETRFGEPGGRELDLWLHRAGLTYGDCFSYALAKISGQPLLFKGDDFRHTDIAVVD